MNFWETVAYELDYCGIDRKKLAQEAGFDVSNISKGIKNGNVPSADTAVRIARILGVSVEYLVQGSGERSVDDQAALMAARFQKYRRLMAALDVLDRNMVLALTEFAEKLASLPAKESVPAPHITENLCL